MAKKKMNEPVCVPLVDPPLLVFAENWEHPILRHAPRKQDYCVILKGGQTMHQDVVAQLVVIC
jgi:hypothetical protein